jgi:hypothetical protein
VLGIDAASPVCSELFSTRTWLFGHEFRALKQGIHLLRRQSLDYIFNAGGH